MKLITAIIKTHKVDEVRDALSSHQIQGITITEAKGYGRQKGHVELYRGAEYKVEFVPKAKLEIAVTDEQLETVVDAIIKGARTGAIGDGKIFITDLVQTHRIRTGETGEEAL